MTFGIKALADDRGSQMKVGYLRVAVALWIVALVAGGDAESYSNRPIAGEMDNIVVQGTECMLGVNERCQATQYATNPVSYQVTPPFVKTNNAGWYLDKDAMGTMASKIRSLVPCYVDPDTVYDGTTNISMLTTNGLWAQLEIGDHMNQFTGTPAIGTNAATYGDYPWRIYAENLQERYQVLNALKILPAMPYWGGVTVGTNWGAIISRTASMSCTMQYQYPANYIYYPYYAEGNEIGPADGNPHSFEIGGAYFGFTSSGFEISMGRSIVCPYGGVFQDKSAFIFMDSDSNTNEFNHYTAVLSFDADTDYVRILNCIDTEAFSSTHSGASVSHTANSATMSVDIDDQQSGGALFEVLQVIEYPFNYCME